MSHAARWTLVGVGKVWVGVGRKDARGLSSFLPSAGHFSSPTSPSRLATNLLEIPPSGCAGKGKLSPGVWRKSGATTTQAKVGELLLIQEYSSGGK